MVLCKIMLHLKCKYPNIFFFVRSAFTDAHGFFYILRVTMLSFFSPFSQEYIVVLVCNGKRQNQVRDDLEAFLGDDSENFVAWYQILRAIGSLFFFRFL